MGEDELHRPLVVALMLFFYSHNDQGFVIDEILNFLERRYGYKLCIHERDFAPGPAIISNITAAIEHSRRVILVISRCVLVCYYHIRPLKINCAF